MFANRIFKAYKKVIYYIMSLTVSRGQLLTESKERRQLGRWETR